MMLDSKGNKSNRYKNPSRGSPDNGYGYNNGDDQHDDRNIIKQNSHDAHYTGPQARLSLNQTGNNRDSGELVW